MNTLTCLSLKIEHHIAHWVLNRPEAITAFKTKREAQFPPLLT